MVKDGNGILPESLYEVSATCGFCKYFEKQSFPLNATNAEQQIKRIIEIALEINCLFISTIFMCERIELN